MSLSLRSLTIIGAITITLAGCGKSVTDQAVEESIEKETGGEATVNTDDGTVEVTTDEGTVTIGTQELPSDWPMDVPVYPGSTVQMAGTIAGKGQGGLFQTTDAKADVVSYFLEQLKKEGWDASIVGDMGAISIMTAKKDERNMALQIATGDGRTSITISLQETTQK
ncbi:MAG: hypothetical protein PHZ00_02425 [Candidatus Peribacteraceae bacterium]|nr:hypothetical protein [Candidatus Peribacteraceae bacterium]